MRGESSGQHDAFSYVGLEQRFRETTRLVRSVRVPTAR
jgi:hypothetical protein